MYKIKDIIPLLEEMAPLAYAEDFDNVGLLVGNPETNIPVVSVSGFPTSNPTLSKSSA